MIVRPVKKSPSININLIASKSASLALALSLSASVALAAPHTVAPEGGHSVVHAAENLELQQLEKGQVVVGLKDVGNTKYVTGKILINEPPEKVWPIMVNPFEFQGKISPRTKKVEVFTDEANLSVMKMTMDTSPVPFLPQMSYTVESRYEQSDKGGRIEFRRIAGVVKDFRGCWDMAPADGGTKTELTYSMYIDPGFFVPQWIVREGVKGELPRTLSALRDRINGVYEGEERPERQTIVAATPKAVHHAAVY
jgi:carbon monoxide dehydrogenase subunit G